MGTIVWRGHPASLTGEMIEAALPGSLTKPAWEWPASADAAKKALVSGKLGEALKAAETSGVKEAVEGIRGLIDGQVKAVKAQLASGDYLGARSAARSAAKRLGELPQAAELRTILEQIKGDPKALKVIEGQEELASLMRKLARARTVAQARPLVDELESLARRYPGTIVATQANASAQDMRRRMR